MNRKVAIIIDDNSEFLEMLEGISFRKKVNLALRYFSSPIEALKYIEVNAHNIEAVFTDYHMNNRMVDGGVVVARCKRFSIPVYLVTGDEAVAQEYLECGFVNATVERAKATKDIFEILKTITEKKQKLVA